MEVTSNVSFEYPKEGYVKAVCLNASDGRYDKNEFNGRIRWTRRIFLIFEIDQKYTRGEYKGKNMIIHKEFVLSSSANSEFRKTLENWRKCKFGERYNENGTMTLMTKKKNNETGQIEEVKFRTESLCGANCILKLTNIGTDKTFIAITEISKLPKNEDPIIRENNIGYLPDYLAIKIALRPEVNPDELSEPIRGYADGYLGEEDDEEVPF
ncbi:hypothetical protein BFL38_14150 [Brachyspira hampsonii]|uniref:Uncharacterized protein n=1 Tax=Brachyspira hampsonii TaxID=1287055 RepID=A0A1E5NGY9_9SPIR|nr:hypothetical protein [Brachyspira hampsonii]OEJ15428.1 hypothetical protein BFL38_14150 [Brachyspira hampsonii]